MRKYLILVFIAVAQMVSAQEARMFNINVDPFEIEGYGLIEAQIRKIIDNGHSPRMEVPNQLIKDRERVKSDLELVYTDSASHEHRSFSCSTSHVERLINALNNFQIIITNPDSLNLQRKGIEKKMLTPPITLDDDGVESTYTEEYYCDFNYFTVGVYTNPKGQAVYYYQFGDVKTAAERNTWRILTNETDSFVKWLEIIQKAM